MQKLQSKQLILFLLISSVFGLSFSGCAKYKPHAFLVPSTALIEKNNVKASATLLTEKNCKYYFSKEIIKNGFQPVQIYIENNGEESLVLDALDITLPIERREYIAHILHFNEAWHTVLIPGIAGSLLAAYPLGMGAYFISLASRGYSGDAGIGFIFGSVLIIAGTLLFLTVYVPFWLAWKKRVKANRQLDKDFMNRILDRHSTIELKPYATLNTVFFVKKEALKLNDKFTLKLYNAENSKNLIFNFELN